MSIDDVLKEIKENPLIPKEQYGDVLTQYLLFYEQSINYVPLESVNKSLDYHDSLKEEWSLTQLRCYIKEKYCEATK